jgi:hypothetical protein
MSDAATAQVIDLIFGRWRSQILYSGTALGVFDHLSDQHATDAKTVATNITADPDLLYRLLRALAAIGLLIEDEQRAFRLSEAGSLLRADHPQSLRAMALLEEGPEHYAIWKHLVSMIRDGRQNGFLREFGAMAFDYAHSSPSYGAVFNQAMSSYSTVQTQATVSALAHQDWSTIETFCDVAGGHGHLICGLLAAYPHLKGIVLDLPEVVGETDRLWAPKLGLTECCRYIGGDMFNDVPAADAYSLKLILHDWNDDECVRILSNLRRAVTGVGRVFIIEHVVPGPDEPHFAKLFDIHMMCWGTGRERTLEEYAHLLATSGWRYEAIHRPSGALVAVIVGKSENA